MMDQTAFDLTYFSEDDAREPYAYTGDGDRRIPMAFNHVVALLAELDELEDRLYRLEQDGCEDGEDDDDEDERLDTRCLIDMRYEDIDQLIEIFCQNMPATLDALVALNAMLLSLEHPDLSSRGSDENDLSTVNARLVRRWLADTVERDPDTEFREFRKGVEYLVNLPYTRIGAPVP
jgi:hypothetical protein